MANSNSREPKIQFVCNAYCTQHGILHSVKPGDKATCPDCEVSDTLSALPSPAGDAEALAKALEKMVKSATLLMANGTSHTMGGKYPTDEEVASVRNWHKCWWEAVKFFQVAETEAKDQLAAYRASKPAPTATRLDCACGLGNESGIHMLGCPLDIPSRQSKNNLPAPTDTEKGLVHMGEDFCCLGQAQGYGHSEDCLTNRAKSAHEGE